jgi:hypothetical protein
MVRGPKKHLKRLVSLAGGSMLSSRQGGGFCLAVHQASAEHTCWYVLQNAPKHWMLDKLGGIFVSTCAASCAPGTRPALH